MQATPTVGRTVEKELFIAAAPERVYQAFTSKQDLESWFVTNADVQAEVGGVFNLRWQGDEKVDGQYVELEPHRRITFTWDERPKYGITTCTIKLIPEADGTLVRLTHTGFGDGDNWDELYNGINSGWTEELGHLKSWLETGVVKSRA
jgi:uncharacterized protein YndB with AHSA1/START domain